MNTLIQNLYRLLTPELVVKGPLLQMKKKKTKKPRVKPLMDLAKTEEDKWRVRQFYMLVLQADKTRMQALEEKDKKRSDQCLPNRTDA